MSEETLAALVEKVKEDPILALVVVKGGEIVLEYYREGSTERTLFNIYSCTKSVTSALFGIALGKGLIADVDRPVSDFYPGISRENRRITLRHFLSMTSGLDWPEWATWDYYFAPMVETLDWVGFVLARGRVSDPGTTFNYNTGGSQVLSGVISMRSGMSAAEFARRELFDKIGIREVTWPADPTGVSYGGYGVRMTARDAARFGFLYLNNGKWEGEQVVPAAWVEESTREQSQGHAWFGRYGLHWWVSASGAGAPGVFFAMGYAGQYIFVVPAADLVAVFLSDMPGEASFRPMRYLEDYVLRSIEGAR